jgi:hypothetical protein
MKAVFQNTHECQTTGFQILDDSNRKSQLLELLKPNQCFHVHFMPRQVQYIPVMKDTLTLSLLMSYIYIYGAPSIARNFNVVYI